jgi:hypothetical protein
LRFFNRQTAYSWPFSSSKVERAQDHVFPVPTPPQQVEQRQTV